MDNYIVRVLRREQPQQDSPIHLDGVVEMVDSGKRRAFHTADELWSILGESIESMDGRVATLEQLTDDEFGRHED